MITFVGLGPGDPDALSRGAERELRQASDKSLQRNAALFLRTTRHPVVDTLREWGIRFESFDALYERSASFDELYESIAARLVAAAAEHGAGGEPLSVVYAVPGHPLIGEASVRLVMERAAEHGIPTRTVSSASFVEPVLAAVRAELGTGCDVRDALALPLSDAVDKAGNPCEPPPDGSRSVILYQVYDPASAAHAKLALMRGFPDDWQVAVVRAAGIAGSEHVVWIPLHALDRQQVDHLTSVFVPALPPAARRPTFGTLVGIMARLRAPGGCPWDREQTHESLRRYFVEETYEVLEAIDRDDPEQLCEELGDALLQVVFHAQLAGEEGIFDIADVCAGIAAKLVRRHPHVFGDVTVADSGEVLKNWEAIKKTEKSAAADARTSALDGVPHALPALMLAMEVSKRAAKTGFEWPDIDGVLQKLDEEVSELKAALAKPGHAAEVSGEIGDLLFTVVQVARWRGIDAETALRDMLARFAARFRFMEHRARQAGTALNALTPAEMDGLWSEAKRQAAG